MPVYLQVALALLAVVLVLWFMWRLPRRDDSGFGMAPILALVSAWSGLFSVAVSLMLWLLAEPDAWVALAFMGLYPLAVVAGIWVLWMYRGHDTPEETIAQQRLQARIGVTLGLIAVILGYWYVLTTKTPTSGLFS